MARANTKSTSVAQKSIAAINKAEKVVNDIVKLPEVFSVIKDEVSSIKEDMELGLKQYEIEIEEKKEALDEKYILQEENWKNKISKLEEDYDKTAASIDKDEEELKYLHNKAIEREDLSTCTSIAEKHNKVVVDKKAIESFEETIKTEIAKVTEAKEVELKEKSRGYAIAENKLKSEYNQKIAVFETQLTASTARVTDLTNQVDYLKEQLDAERKASVERLEAAKSDISVQNDNTGRK